MHQFTPKGNNAIRLSILMGFASLLVVAGVVYSPSEAFRASLTGLQIWWTQVFPGLLPPLILAELLATSGLLHGLATLSEPLTRLLFRLPGASGWAIAFGWCAGIPVGALETSRLRERELIQDDDVDTLLIVSHFPNPFLIILVIGCGFLQSPMLGWAIAIGLWLSVIITGIIWAHFVKGKKYTRIHDSSNTTPEDFRASDALASPSLFERALDVASTVRESDSRPFGKQLADSVSRTVTTLMIIGGLMMMCSVFIRLLQIWMPGNDFWITFAGLYDMHLGAYEGSKSALFASAPVYTAALLAAALAWSGWSGLLQARAAFGAASPFPWGRLIAGRLLHGGIALLITFPLASFFTSEQVALFANRYLPFHWRSVDAWASDQPLPNGWLHLSDTLIVAIASFSVFLLLALAAALIRPKPPKNRD
ncbi:MAG: hypothetical protein P0Y55_09390 [Candidatus Cohnella colombiensis]|uniref:Nucleoside recognition domain-containing protein n=1 Tax=Candidatus Cohnella colombiensis TaxID=3121368 RepID=A0AA95F3K7_9BACL|nr:MAG: hypothetical protein P0Y55_09390 [Cohnella sp.]